MRRIVWLERHPEVNVIWVGNLETRRTIVDVRDLNRSLILLLDRGKSGEVYNLGGPTAYPMSAVLLRVLQRASRSDIVPEVDPKLLRSTDEPIIWADCTKLKLATRWEPAISLEQTIDDRLSWRQKPERALVVSRLRSIPTTLERCGQVPSDEGTPRPDRTRLFTAPAGNSELVAMSVLCRRPNEG